MDYGTIVFAISFATVGLIAVAVVVALLFERFTRPKDKGEKKDGK